MRTLGRARTIYTIEYQAGYPRNIIVETTLNHTVPASTYTVRDAATLTNLTQVAGFYEIQPGQTVVVLKAMALPTLPDYNDTTAADPACYGVYAQSDLDKTITWVLDERIDLTLSAARNASTLAEVISAVNTYAVSR